VNILIADQEAVSREHLRAWLEAEGHQVREAASYPDLQALLSETPDVLLVAARLPAMPSRPELPNYTGPVILLVGYATASHARAWLHLNVHALIPKPLDRELVRWALARATRPPEGTSGSLLPVVTALAHHINNLLTAPYGVGKSLMTRQREGEVLSEEELDTYFRKLLTNLEKIRAVVEVLKHLQDIKLVEYVEGEPMVDLERELETTFREIEQKWSR
jgi:CheY-like chemotaxis protein